MFCFHEEGPFEVTCPDGLVFDAPADASSCIYATEGASCDLETTTGPGDAGEEPPPRPPEAEPEDEPSDSPDAGPDERSGAPTECHTFACDGEHWLPEAYVCDDSIECFDGSDEADCEPFVCESGRGVPAAWRCDLEEDCSDGSDEVDCPEPFTCSSGATISRKWVCDGEADCLAGDDEANCSACK